jgi:hypothetical protein
MTPDPLVPDSGPPAEPAEPADDEAIEFCGIRISGQEISEMAGGHAAGTVPLAGIRSATLRRGWQAERAMAMAGCGAVLTALGLAPLPFVIGWLLRGGVLHISWALMLVWLPLGGWVLSRAARRGFFLAVDGGDGCRKLAFSGRAERRQVEAFLDLAERRFGYVFTRDQA